MMAACAADEHCDDTHSMEGDEMLLGGDCGNNCDHNNGDNDGNLNDGDNQYNDTNLSSALFTCFSSLDHVEQLKASNMNATSGGGQDCGQGPASWYMYPLPMMPQQPQDQCTINNATNTNTGNMYQLKPPSLPQLSALPAMAMSMPMPRQVDISPDGSLCAPTPSLSLSCSPPTFSSYPVHNPANNNNNHNHNNIPATDVVARKSSMSSNNSQDVHAHAIISNNSLQNSCLQLQQQQAPCALAQGLGLLQQQQQQQQFTMAASQLQQNGIFAHPQSQLPMPLQMQVPPPPDGTNGNYNTTSTSTSTLTLASVSATGLYQSHDCAATNNTNININIKQQDEAAVSVASFMTAMTNTATPNVTNDVPCAEKELAFKRARNRVYAKKSRDRKQCQVQKMQIRLTKLQNENDMLKALLAQENGNGIDFGSSSNTKAGAEKEHTNNEQAEDVHVRVEAPQPAAVLSEQRQYSNVT